MIFTMRSRYLWCELNRRTTTENFQRKGLSISVYTRICPKRTASNLTQGHQRGWGGCGGAEGQTSKQAALLLATLRTSHRTTRRRLSLYGLDFEVISDRRTGEILPWMSSDRRLKRASRTWPQRAIGRRVVIRMESRYRSGRAHEHAARLHGGAR